MDQAVQVALAGHPLLQAADYELQAAHAQARGARALANPEVRVGPGVLGPEGSDELLSVFQPLEINGARQARVRIALGQLDEQEARVQQSRQDLVLQVKQAYWEAALAQQIHELDLQNLEYAQTLVEAAATQCALGNQPQVQVERAEVEAARANLQALQSASVAAQRRAALNAAMGRLPQASLRLAEGPAPITLQFTLEELQSLALTRRPEVLQAQAAARIIEGELAAARAARRTDLAVQARLTPEGLGGVGLSLNFPQLDWGGLRAEQQRAQAAVHARAKSLEAVQHQVRLEVAQALSAFDAAQAQSQEYQQRVVEQSRRLADLALLGYREGASTFLDVLEARRTLRAVNVEHLSVLSEQRKAQAQLERAVAAALPDQSDPATRATEVK